MKKFFRLFLILSIAFVIVGCKQNKVVAINIIGDEFVVLGKTTTLQAEVLPKEARQDVTWTSSNFDVASIDAEGVVSGKKVGVVTIRATSKADDKIYKEFNLEVITFRILGQRSIKLNEQARFTIKVLANNFDSEVQWSSSNPTVASVSTEGLVEGLSIGEATIVATSLSDANITASFPVRIGNPDNADFFALLDQIFLDMLGTDPMNINFSLYYPEVYGLENCVVEPYTFSMEEEAEYFQELKDMKSSLEAFSDSVLSENQILDKIVLIDYLNHQLAYEGFYYYGSNLGSYLGYQAQLPIILAEYRFDDKKDIENYFDYLRVNEDTFLEIVKFEKEKAALGMGLTDVIIDRVIEQCDAFIDAEECYLIPVFNSKVANLTFLTQEEKDNYITLNATLVVDKFVKSYITLKEQLLTMKGQNTGTGALASYEKGKEYYQVLFQENIGTNMTIPEVKTYLERILTVMMDAYRKNSAAYSRDYDTDLIGSMGILDLIPFFLDNMEKDFPSLGFTPQYEIKEIHASLQDHSSPAMYFLSPLDGNKDESIYINPKNFTDLNNSTYQTIAHEGCPGHLYQHVYLKNTNLPLARKNLSVTGYAEGWTTYIENFILNYHETGKRPSVMKSFEFYDSAVYIIIGLADIGINYDGWSIEETGNFLSQYLSLDEEKIVDIFYDMTEIPTNYLQYYFSYYQMKDLKTYFKNGMGSDYTDYLFHKIFLETGPTSFNILKDQYTKYINDYAGH